MRPASRARALLVLVLAPAAALPAQSPRELLFDVMLDERRIGTHSFQLSPLADGALRVESRARFEVRLLGITLYRYSHEATEQWAQGCLQQLDSHTDDDGERRRVHALRPQTCIPGYAYWDPQRLIGQTSLLNPQTGEVDPVHIEPVAEETVRLGSRELPARRYRLRSDKLLLDLWYDPDGRWLKLESPARGDRKLRYLLRE